MSNQILNPLRMHTDNRILGDELQIEGEMLDGAQRLPELMHQVVHAGDGDGRVQKGIRGIRGST